MTERPWLAHYPSDVEHELVPPPFETLPQLIAAAVAEYGDTIAFTQCMPNGMNGSLSYEKVDALSDAFAAYLREDLGLAAGDRVAVQMPNCLSFPVVAFGVFKAGCVLVNTNPLYTANEMIHQFSDSGAKALVIIDMFADRLPEVIPATGIETVVTVRIAEFFPPVIAGVIRLVQKVWSRSLPAITVDHTPFQTALKRGRESVGNSDSYLEGVGADTVAALQYTGGTTGVAKGAMLTHANLISNTLQMMQLLGTHIRAGQETVLTALPLYHIFAFTVNLIGFFHKGARNILIPSPRPPSNLKRAFENYKITWTTGVNTLFNALLNERWFTENPPRHLVASAAGGMALHESVSEQWRKVTGTPIVEGYGLTETSPALTFNPLDGGKDGTIGIPVPSTDLRLVAEDGTDVGVGESGEIIARGPQVMPGYWQRENDTAESMLDGWFRTGDIAQMDSDGYFTIVDRKKDMILVSGFNAYPNEIEERIAAMEGVMEVGVVGLPDDRTGEAIRAYIVGVHGEHPTEAQVIAHCRETLAAYKVPKSVRFVDELPKSPIGKILRRELRALAVTSETASIETQGRELS